MLILFLGTSTSNSVLKEASPPVATGSGTRMHTDVPLLLWAPCGMQPDSKVSAGLSDQQHMSWSHRYDCTLAGTNRHPEHLIQCQRQCVHQAQVEHVFISLFLLLPYLSPTLCRAAWMVTQQVIRLKGSWPFTVRTLVGPMWAGNWALNFTS